MHACLVDIHLTCLRFGAGMWATQWSACMRRENELGLLSLFSLDLLYVLVHAGEQPNQMHVCIVDINLTCFHYFPMFWSRHVSNTMNCMHASWISTCVAFIISLRNAICFGACRWATQSDACIHSGYQLDSLSLFPYVLVQACEQHNELHACVVNMNLDCFHYFPRNCYMFWCMHVSNPIKCMHA